MLNIPELQSLGLLRATKVPAELDWLSSDEMAFLIQLRLAGEEGMKKRTVLKYWKNDTDSLIRLQGAGLADWQSDRLGKPAFFALSWKGIEKADQLLAVARTQSQGGIYNPEDNV